MLFLQCSLAAMWKKLRLGSRVSTATIHHVSKTNSIFVHTIKNFSIKIIRQAKYPYYNNFFTKFKNDIQNIWLTIKDIINDNKKEGSVIDYLSIKQEISYDKHRIAEELNSLHSLLQTLLLHKIKVLHII